MNDRFDQARRIGDAVMFEGYILYPYRASAMKNRFRWQFGVVVPERLWTGLAAESWYAQTECLIEPAGRARLSVLVRCLQLQRRMVELQAPSGEWRACSPARVGGCEVMDWDEAVSREISCADLPIETACRTGHRVPFTLEGGLDVQPMGTDDLGRAARVVRRRWPIEGCLLVTGEELDGLVRLRIRVENTSAGASAADSSTRDEAIRQALLGCHTVAAVEGGTFLSLLDPPADRAGAATACRNEHTWPVLVGPAGSCDTLLSSPIILYDYPAIAPESQGDSFDATEIDELLALRVMTLTGEERRAAAATDARAMAIVQRAAGQSPADMARLHGAVRARSAPQPAPDSWETALNPPSSRPVGFDAITIGGAHVAAGTRVRLEPRRRADAMDMFLAGRTATVAGIFHDLDDRVHVAVTVDDDPGADLHQAFARFLYFSSDEIVPLAGEHADAGL